MEINETNPLYNLIIEAQKGSNSAQEQLLSNHIKLVYALAKRFYDRGVEKEDLHQIGVIGLLKAIHHFDTTRALQFSTYAVPMILGELKSFFRDNGPLKVSRSLKQIAAKTAKFTEEMQKKEGRTPGILELSDALNLPPEDIIKAKEATRPPESFFAKGFESGLTLSELLPDKEQETALVEHLDLKNAINALPKREQTIILMRYEMEKSQTEVAKKLGISQVQVSRLEKKILTSFKNRLNYQL